MSTTVKLAGLHVRGHRQPATGNSDEQDMNATVKLAGLPVKLAGLPVRGYRQPATRNPDLQAMNATVKLASLAAGLLVRG